MQDYEVAHRVRVYLSEGDSWHHQPMTAAILALIRREDGAGATVLKGVAGFGVHGQIHTAALVDLAGPLPIIIEWVDAPERVQRVLPSILEMVESLVTVEEVRVVQHPHRALRDVPARLRVRDVMTPADQVDVATPDTSLRDLVVLLLRKRRNAIPVVDQERRVVGIITSSDLVEQAGLPLRLELLRALGEPDQPAVAEHLAAMRGEGRTAASIMTPDVVTVGPEVPLAETAQLMLTRRLKRLPVVGEDGRLVGIVSRFDILKTVGNGFSRPLVEALPPGSINGRLPRHIGEVMNRDVPMVRPDTPLPEVLDAVMSTRLHRAVVVDDERHPVGGIVDTDLMQRVTPAAHPGLIGVLMHRVRPSNAQEQAEWQHRTGQRAADVMRPPDQLLIVPADAGIAGVIDQALARKLKIVIVTDHQGRVVGMADRADLLGALAGMV